MRFTSIVLAAALLLVEASAVEKREQEICPGQVIVSETFIGKDNNVKFTELFCPENVATQTLNARQVVDVCNDTCTTFCFNPAGGGPNPNDCNVIADALLFTSQNSDNSFNIGTGTNNTVALTYLTCQTFYVNQDPVEQSYCFNDWAGIVGFIAPNCQATQNAHGGLCVADDGQWFIQVQATPPPS